MRPSLLQISLLFLALPWLGCERGAPTSATPKTGVAERVQASGEVVEELSPELKGESFVLSAREPEEPLAVGQAYELMLALEGRNGWHVNQDYPIEVALDSSEQLTLKTKNLAKEEAKVFDEVHAVFAVPVMPKAVGEHWVECEVSFAMCTDENCVLERRTVRRELAVN